jgi:hypothetical protein
MRHLYAWLEMDSYRKAHTRLPFVWRNGAGRLAILLAGGFSLALAGQVWHNVHYAAPATGLFILFVL